jgi:integrase
MPPTAEARKRGRIDTLPSGSMRVRVFAGYDPVTGKRYDLTETVPARPTVRETRREAEKARTRLLSQIDERRNPRSRVTVNDLIDRWLDVVKLEATTRQGYVGKIEKHLRPTIGRVEVGKLDAETIDSLYAALRRCKEHCGGRSYIEHRTAAAHDCAGRDGVRACAPHSCTPLSDGSIRVIHSILKTSLNRAVRWKWIAVNPISFIEPPPIPAPDPCPPSPAQAAVILAEAFKDPDWGTLVWLAMVAGARRGEFSALRWADLDLDRGTLTVGRSIGQLGGRSWEKNTKTHQRRRISLDAATVQLLDDHRRRCTERCTALGIGLDTDSYVFSLDPDNSTPLRPGTITQRYGRMAKALRLDTHFHALRHYSATELIAAGVDPRTVAGRLGHGGGGATTLRVYSAWVPESDRKAAETIAARMPVPPRSAPGT